MEDGVYLDMLVEVVSLIVVALTESASEVLDDGADLSTLMLRKQNDVTRDDVTSGAAIFHL